MSTPDKWIRLVATFTFLTGTSFNALAICDVESKNEQAAAVGVGANSEAVQQKRLADMLRSFTEYGQKNRDELRISIEQKIAGDFELRTSGGRRSQLTNLQLTICMLNAASQNSAKQNDTSTNSKNNSSAATDPQQNQSTQQQSQQAQQQAQQAQEAARVAQTRADQARQGQRRRHEPENEASQCIQPDFGGLYGGMKNTCDFKVWYTYCGYRPKESSWLTGMSCEKQSFGSDSVGPGRTSASHTKGVESIHWIACKEPAWTVDTEFVPGQGIKGRCHTVGGK